MEYKRLMQVMKKTQGVVRGREEIGLLVTGQDPLVLSDMDLVSFIQNAGIEDVEEVFDTMGLDIRHGSLAAMAFAVSQISSREPSSSVTSSQPTTTDPPRAPNMSSFIGQTQSQTPPAPGPSNQMMMMNPQMIQSITEAVTASLMNAGWTAPGQAAQPPTGGACGGKDHDMEVDGTVVVGEASPSEAATCTVYDSSDIPTTVSIPRGIIEKIFVGSPAEVANIIQSSSIKDKQDVSGASGADIEYTLRYLKVESFSITDTPLHIEAVKASNTYSLTVPRIDFKVKGEFKYKMSLFGLGPKGTGSFDVVARNWSIKTEFRFDAERDGGVILNMVSCSCVQDDVELVNLDCSVPELMKVFTKTPKNYVAEEMNLKLVDTFQSVIHKSAKEVLKTVTYRGAREDLQMNQMYPGMKEDCILRVCNATLGDADLRAKLMTMDPNLAHLLPDDVIPGSIKEGISKIDRHNPTVQAKGSFVTALQESIDQTKVVRLLRVLENGQALLAKKIEAVHKEEIRRHKASCHRCSNN